MKLFYCIASVYNPGGMERVLLNKISWFVRKGGYEITLVTTDQDGRPPFYDFPPEVKMVDLGINYSRDNGRNPLLKILGYLRRKPLHRRRLKALLLGERPDITVSLYPSESSFIPGIKDGSKKILELHFNKFFRLQYGRTGLLGLADRFRSRQDERIVSKFDKFVVLTREDASYWGALPNIEVIPNAALAFPDVADPTENKRVIAVGRLDYQKGFDRLLKAWSLLPANILGEWHLDIFGQGEWKDMLEKMIKDLGISGSARINPPTEDIMKEYSSSAFLAMSSHFEGQPMVMLEAMSCGLPVVSFDFKCGPKDMIVDGKNGLLVKEGDIPALADAMTRMASDCEARKSMGEEAAKVVAGYSEESIMEKWEQCFENIL